MAVPELVTVAFVPGAPVVVVPTVTVAGAPGRPVAPTAPVSPRGITKFKTAFCGVPELVTTALVPGAPVKVVPTVTVGANGVGGTGGSGGNGG